MSSLLKFQTRALSTLCVLLFAVTVTSAQTYLDSLYSEILNEQRSIEIILPWGYDANADEVYDVIYVLDGEWNSWFISQVHLFACYDFIPKNIIVSVKNRYVGDKNLRERDFLPTAGGRNESQFGHAENFLAFLKTELIPYINKKLKTSENKTLFGASHGGTFTVYALLKEPGLFKSYIASDPSLWWDNNYVAHMATTTLPKLKNNKTNLYIAGREGNPYKSMGIVNMIEVLEKFAPGSLNWEAKAYPNETHNSVAFKCVYDGLKFSYSDYRKPQK